METGDETERTPRCLREENNGEVSCSKACVGEPLSDALGGDHHTGLWQRTGAVGEGDPAHPDDTCGGVLQPTWRTGSSWLLDRCDEEAGREEQYSPIFDLQWCVSSVVYGYKIAMFVHTALTLALIATGAFSQNICKLFSVGNR